MTLNELLAAIRLKAELLLPQFLPDTLALDKALGELDLLILDARLLIDIEWREACRLSQKPRLAKDVFSLPPTLDELA